MSEFVEISEVCLPPASRNTKARAGTRAPEREQYELAPRLERYVCVPATSRAGKDPSSRGAACSANHRPTAPSGTRTGASDASRNHLRMTPSPGWIVRPRTVISVFAIRKSVCTGLSNRNISFTASRIRLGSSRKSCICSR